MGCNVYSWVLAGAVAVLTSTGAYAAEQVSFPARDGGVVYADAYTAAAPAKGTIVLFHQAGSNRAEYETIAPRLVTLGYNVLATDQRSGGSMWGHENRTAAAHASASSYQAALPDLEGAVGYATKTWAPAPVIIWGSSYSASLVFVVAARDPDHVTAVLSFSPGEYFSGLSVRDSAAKVRCPVFVTSASSSDEVSAAHQIVAAVPGARKTHFVPARSVHGSSTLRPDVNPSGAPQVWTEVERFLASLR